MSENDTTDADAPGAHADLPSGVRMYHEVHGAGRPTILIHGGIAASEVFGATLDLLAEGRQVIAVHLQGHGRTPDLDRPLRDELLADDVAALVAHLGHPQVDLVGYSLGGGVAVQAALRHPGLVRRLVVVSQPFRSDVWFPEARAQLDGMEAAAEQVGAAVQAGPLGQQHPDVDFVTLFRKTGELVARPYDWTGDVAALNCPTFLVAADGDGFDLGHVVEVFHALGGNRRDPGIEGTDRPPHRLAIVPGATHYDLFTGAPRLAEPIAAFLDG